MNANVKISVSLLILFVLAFILISCAAKNESELYGEYLTVNSSESERLTLYADHVYIRIIYTKDSNNSIEEKGKWEYVAEQYNRVYLKPDLPNRPYMSKAVENWFGVIYIGMNNDGAKLYRKID